LLITADWKQETNEHLLNLFILSCCVSLNMLYTFLLLFLYFNLYILM